MRRDDTVLALLLHHSSNLLIWFVIYMLAFPVAARRLPLVFHFSPSSSPHSPVPVPVFFFHLRKTHSHRFNSSRSVCRRSFYFSSFLALSVACMTTVWQICIRFIHIAWLPVCWTNDLLNFLYCISHLSLRRRRWYSSRKSNGVEPKNRKRKKKKLY